MKRAVEFKETIDVRHQIVVEVGNEEDIDFISSLEGRSIDEILIDISKEDDIKILEVNEDYSLESNEDVEYWDDYWTDREKEQFGN